MRIALLSLIVATFCGQAVFAKKAEIKYPPVQIKTMTDKEYKKALKKAKKRVKVRRFAATNKIDELEAMSESYRNLRNRFIGGPVFKGKVVDESKEAFKGVNSAKDLSEFLTFLDANYDTFDSDAKLVAAQFLTLKPFEGILYRFRPLMDKRKHRLAHSTIVLMLRGMQTGINTYFPDEQWQAGYDFLATPGASYNESMEIENDSDFFHFVRGEVVPSVNKFIERMDQLTLDNGNMFFDNQLLYKSAKFVDSEDRYVRVVQSDITGFKGAGLIALSGLLYSTSYEWTGFFALMDDLWENFGISAKLSWRGVERATAARRVDTIRGYSSLFKLRGDEGRQSSQQAYDALKEGFRHMNLAFEMKGGWDNNNNRTRNRSEFSQFGADFLQGTTGFTNFVDPRAMLPFNRFIGLSFANIRRLLEEEDVASALINGEVRKVNMKTFFYEPASDLKSFLPVTFHVNGVSKEMKCPSNDKYDDCRNYTYGSPKAWNYTLYSKYFPQIEKSGKAGNIETSEDIKEYGRILAQVWGGQIVAVPLTGALF